MQTEEEAIVTTSSPDVRSSGDLESASEALRRVEARMSPERLDLLKRTLKVRRLIGKVSTNVAELVHEMREHGA